MTEMRWRIHPISNEEMDDLIESESHKTRVRLIGYPQFRSPDGRLYPLAVYGVRIKGDYFVVGKQD
jgi:hypothetical protein